MPKRSLVLFLLFLAACGPVQAPPPPTSSPGPPTASVTPPATPTALPSPTPTPLPATPLPRFFTEEFDGQLPAWSILQSNQDGAPQTTLTQGTLTFQLDEAYQWAYAIIGAQEYADVRVDALVQSRGTGPDAIGVLCRYSEANGWYEFNISSDGTYSVLFGQWLAPGVASYAPIASDRSEYLNAGGAENEIGLACHGDTLTLYLNGKLFRNLDVSRFGLVLGRLGLSVASFENVPVSAAYDRLRVSQP